jgi:type I restriction enzyme R subunit
VAGEPTVLHLEPILKKQLEKIAAFNTRQKSFLSDSNINAAIIALRELPIQDGFIKRQFNFYRA